MTNRDIFSFMENKFIHGYLCYLYQHVTLDVEFPWNHSQRTGIAVIMYVSNETIE